MVRNGTSSVLFMMASMIIIMNGWVLHKKCTFFKPLQEHEYKNLKVYASNEILIYKKYIGLSDSAHVLGQQPAVPSINLC